MSLQNFSIFSGTDPHPKDEASYDQWGFQVRGTMISHSVAVVRSGIVNSVQGKIRELVGFLGFDMSLDIIINKIEECYNKTWNANKFLTFTSLWSICMCTNQSPPLLYVLLEEFTCNHQPKVNPPKMSHGQSLYDGK